jgi:hypothetical protein
MSGRERANQPATGEELIRGDIYGPGVLDEVTVPPTDPVREAKRQDWGDPAHVQVDPEDLRNGGPTRTPGVMTTTGGSAGPARMAPPGGTVDTDDTEAHRTPTTTGDATTGGMRSPVSTGTSDNEGPAGAAANVTDR